MVRCVCAGERGAGERRGDAPFAENGLLAIATRSTAGSIATSHLQGHTNFFVSFSAEVRDASRPPPMSLASQQEYTLGEQVSSEAASQLDALCIFVG